MLTREAEALHRQGDLSIRRLRARVGGGDTERLVRVARAVREAAGDSNPHTCAASKSDETANEAPQCTLEAEFALVQAAVRSQIDSVRATEIERSRTMEAAAAARHEEEMASAAAELVLLREDVADLEQSVTAHPAEIGRLTAVCGLAENALARSEEERRAAAQLHAQERMTLAESAAKLQTLAAHAFGARAAAEGEMRRAIADGTRLARELERERMAVVELRAGLGESERRRTAAERERNEAVARREELAGRIENHPTSCAPLCSRPRRSRVTSKRTGPLSKLLEQAKAALATRACARSGGRRVQQLDLPGEEA